MPTRNSPIASSVVPTGRRMKGSEIDAITASPRWRPRPAAPAGPAVRHRLLDPAVEPVEREIDHRRRVERQQLAQQQAADDGNAERKAQLGAGAAFDRQRQRAEQRGQRRHHDRAEAQQAGLHDRVVRRHALMPLRFQREVDHHDRVLLDDAHQQDDADQADHRQVLPEQHQRQNGADAGRGQRRENGDRVDVALIEHAEHDVDRDDRGQDQPGLAGQRFREFGGVAGIDADDAAGHADPRFDRLDRLDGIAERRAGREVEAERDRRKLRLMRDRQRRGGARQRRHRRQRHLRAGSAPGR